MPDETAPLVKAETVPLPTTVTRYVPLLRTNKDKWTTGQVCKNADEALKWLTEVSGDSSNCRVAIVELPL